MNIPIVGGGNKMLARRAFEDTLTQLCQSVIYQGGMPAVEVSMALIHQGMSIHTQTVMAALSPMPKTNGMAVHEPEATALAGTE